MNPPATVATAPPATVATAPLTMSHLATAATAPPAMSPPATAATAPPATAPPAMVLQAMAHPAMVPKNLLLRNLPPPRRNLNLRRNLPLMKMSSGALELRIGEGGQISNVRRLTGRKREERREMPQFTVNTPR